MLGVSDQLGTLAAGKLANFIITSDTLFKEGTIIYENWVQGEKSVTTKVNVRDITGEYATTVPGVGAARLFIGDTDGKLTAHLKISNDTAETKVTAARTGDLVSFSFNPQGQEGSARINGYLADGTPLKLKGERKEERRERT